MSITVGPIKRGSIVALDFPPILGRVVNVNRNRSAFLVDFGEFVKWFQVRRLSLAEPSLYREMNGFQSAHASRYPECGGSSQPADSTVTTVVNDSPSQPELF